MTEVAKVRIDLDSKADLKGFKQVETASQKLTKSVKTLGAAFGLALSATAIINYGKATIRAFAADEKAAKTLSRTLNNLGLAFVDPEIKTFIATLEKQYGVLDDKLRPAFTKLITTTGDYKKSQSLLTTALDLSAQSGVDLVSVSDDLARAYVGNNKGLVKYNLGLTKAQIAAMSFEDILKRITVISAGQAALAADTYAGKLDKLTVASENAKEVLGGALLDALVKLGGGDVDKATDKIDKLSTALADLIRLATGTSAISLKDILQGVDYKFGFIPTDRPKAARSASPAGTFKNQQAAEKARAAAIKQEKYLAKLAKEQAAAALATAKAKKLSLAIDKANIALGKGAGIFDIEGIQLNAALINQAEQLGKATSAAQLLQIANDTARLNVKKSISDLEDAIASKDEAAITAATKKLNADLGILGALTGQKTQLLAIETILTGLVPKDLINLANLNAALALLQAMATIKITPITAAQTTSPTATQNVSKILSTFKGSTASAFESLTPSQQATLGGYEPFTGASISNMPEQYVGSSVGLGLNGTGRQVPQGVTVNVSAGVIAQMDEFTALVQRSIQSLNRNGNNLEVAGIV